MGRGKCLNEQEKSKIVQQLKQGKTIKQISAIVKRDLRTITRFLDDPLKKTVRMDQGKMKTEENEEIEENANNQEPSFLKMRAFKISPNPPGAKS